LEIHFVGTGKTANDPEGYTIRPVAEEYGLYGTVIFEYPRRIPYLDVLVHLEAVDGVFILGSTEPHYTPSKVYQGVLSGKPLLAVLHTQSSAVEVIRRTGAGMVLDFDGEREVDRVRREFIDIFRKFKVFMIQFDRDKVDMKAFKAYSAHQITGTLTALIDKVNTG
jgi:hypothetical protein